MAPACRTQFIKVPSALKVVWHVLLEALTLAMWKVLPLADNITNSREMKVFKYCSNLTFDTMRFIIFLSLCLCIIYSLSCIFVRDEISLFVLVLIFSCFILLFSLFSVFVFLTRSRRASQDITRTSDSVVPWQR